MVFGERRENLAVKGDVFLFERVNERAVGETERAHGGIDADIPERAKVVLLVLAMRERVLAGVEIRLPRGALFMVQRLRDYVGVDAMYPELGERVELK